MGLISGFMFLHGFSDTRPATIPRTGKRLESVCIDAAGRPLEPR